MHMRKVHFPPIFYYESIDEGTKPSFETLKKYVGEKVTS